MNFPTPDQTLAALVLLACCTMLVRMALGERARARLDAWGLRLLRRLQGAWARVRGKRAAAPRRAPAGTAQRPADLRAMRPPRPPRAGNLRLVESKPAPAPKDDGARKNDAAREAQALIDRARRAANARENGDGGPTGG